MQTKNGETGREIKEIVVRQWCGGCGGREIDDAMKNWLDELKKIAKIWAWGVGNNLKIGVKRYQISYLRLSWKCWQHVACRFSRKGHAKRRHASTPENCWKCLSETVNQTTHGNTTWHYSNVSWPVGWFFWTLKFNAGKTWKGHCICQIFFKGWLLHQSKEWPDKLRRWPVVWWHISLHLVQLWIQS